jgi:hypothetical protein
MKRRSAFWTSAVFGITLAAAAIAPAHAQSISDKMNQWLFGPPITHNPSTEPGAPAEINCPGVGVRAGASTLAVTAPGQDAGPMSTRYQASIGETARECATAAGMMTMRVGVQGRILLGPAGGPGQLDVPLRLAVVREGAEPKMIWSKLYRFNVSIPPGQTAVPFTQVAQDVSFPLPGSDELEAYVVYVGFDPSAAPIKPEPRKKQKKKQ